MPDSLRSGPLDKQKPKIKTMNMKKLSVLLLATTVLFSSCGQPTYDIDNPEESSAEMVKNLSAEEKVAFARAVQKITLHELNKKGLSLMEMARLAKNPEAAKELLRCLDGKSVDEIIELSKNLD